MADLLAAIRAALDDCPTEEIRSTTSVERVAEHIANHPALDGWFREDTRVPEEFAGMSAHERGVWLSVERFYDAALRAEGIEKNERSRTAFRELVPDAQQAVILTLVPVIQMLHSIALNPEARRG